MRWDPAQYGRFSDQRSRPFFDLVGRIGAAAPARVVDLGCGSGELTVTLAERWPEAEIVGVDSSAEMLARAPRTAGVDFRLGDAASFDARGVDVLLSNAALQWVPDHRELIGIWARQLAPDGWLAVQVPDQNAAPSHRLMVELARSAEWHERLAGVRRPISVARPEEYLDVLTAAGWSADVWQTEYLQVLHGPDPVLEWVRGTSLGPWLAPLDAAEAERFCAELAERLAEAYPTRDYGTPYPFRRTFVVAHRD